MKMPDEDSSENKKQVQKNEEIIEKTIIPLESIDQYPDDPDEVAKHDDSAEVIKSDDLAAVTKSDDLSVVNFPDDPSEIELTHDPKEDTEEDILYEKNDDLGGVIKEEKKYDPYSAEKEQQRRNAERLRALNYTNISDPKKVDELEREPAYKRKHIPVQGEMFPEEKETSRYTVGGKGNRLRSNNTYLHDAVD